MDDLAARIASRLASVDRAIDLRPAFRARGVVVRVGDGVAEAFGLGAVGNEELVSLDSGALAMAHDLLPDRTGLVLLSRADRVRAGEGATPLGRLPSIDVSDEMLGRVVDPLGRPFDDGPRVDGPARSMFRPAPDLVDRAPVARPLATGILAIDAAIPIGRGQRQLIIGDRNVGKTSLALDIVAAQSKGDVVCVYVLVGQPMSRVLAIREMLVACSALSRTVIVAADAAATPGLQYLAPYAGTTVAEHFCDRGRDVVVVYDDLTKHADAYRELSLLLGRPPGREAFPGDIFHVHAELLERATARKSEAGGGSITAFPLVETTDSDIAAYIPTNLISITDGQIYLDAARFERNERPAIDVGKSVSRIGGAAQSAAIRRASRNIRILQTRFESLESLTRFGFDVDAVTQTTVTRGRILQELVRQPRFSPRSVVDHIVSLVAVSEGWLDTVPTVHARPVIALALERLASVDPNTFATLSRGDEPPGEWTTLLRGSVEASIEALR